MSKTVLEALRREVAHIERGSSPVASDRFSTGSETIDSAVGGGLARGALHEIFGASVMDGASAAGFAIALAVRASENKPVVWCVRISLALSLARSMRQALWNSAYLRIVSFSFARAMVHLC